MTTDGEAYRRRVRAWITYDWANSAFTTTVLAAVLPVYYSSTAGATLPSAATATQYYTLTLSASVLVVAVLSPVLGAVADAAGTRKRFLLGFAALGVVATAGLFGVGTGDWVLASVLLWAGRIGFAGANVFYDALLPHVATPDDMDRVSARGYGWGYVGGGLLLAADAALIVALPEADLGYRLSFLTVAIWWAVFSAPLARHVPEPAPLPDRDGGRAVRDAVREVVATVRGLAHTPDLRRFLIAFLIYNDAIGTVITVAAIYGAELGFSALELILAILLVQFLGMPYALLFGALPTSQDRRRRRALTAFLVANVALLPAAGIGMRALAPADVTGTAGPPIADRGVIVAPPPGPDGDVRVEWTGQSVEIRYTAGPDQGELSLRLDGAVPTADGQPITIDAGGPAVRRGETARLDVATVGPHVLDIAAPGDAPVPVEAVEVLPADRESDLAVVFGALLAVQVVAAAFALTVGRRLCAPLADDMTAKRAVLISLVAYAVVAVWGFALDSVVEFWGLAWLVGVVQGGSQALSRSIYARLTPESRSGEFFGFFSILSKFASVLSPLLFTASAALFDSSRPAVLSLLAFFVTGIALLRRVDVDRGAALARQLDGRPDTDVTPPS